jgi:ParB family chromosome partitioning protein
MAKRKRLISPTDEDLKALDAEFRSETPARPSPSTVPIAQVAADAAFASNPEPAQIRLDRMDAERLRDAQDRGLIVTEIATHMIHMDAMIRDRTVLNAEEMAELQASIAANGLRLPIEVFEAGVGGYALLSGYRRLLAVRALEAAGPGNGRYTLIKAFIRPAADTATAFAAMVEENEVRANLSHFERGRIAVIAAQEGAFESTESAVNGLFAAASKSKRSKVKSFAEVFEMLGDMLRHAESLSERRGLRLAGALRQGGEVHLRAALEAGQGGDADQEWAVLEPVIVTIEGAPRTSPKMGRPPAVAPVGWVDADTLKLASGVTLQKGRDGKGFVVRLCGKPVTEDRMGDVMVALQRMFDEK